MNHTPQSVSFRQVTKSFGAVQVLAGLDLEIAPGEFLVLLGESGSGKSTALRALAGLETVTSGAIHVGARDVTHLPPKERDIALVFQNYALYPHMTVAENIGYPLKLRGLKPAGVAAAVQIVAEQVKLSQLLDRRPSELSGGQRQRVALARAMVRRPAVFLLDEPLSNLDAKLRGHMRAELKHLQQQLGVTTLYVTHDQVEALTLAHRIAVLDKGVLQQLDTPQRIYQDPANLFVAGFVGSPSMNFLHGRIVDGRFLHPQFELPLAAHGDLDRAVLGLRPEHCSLLRDGEPAPGPTLPCSLYALEDMGDQAIATLDVADSRLCVKLPAGWVPDGNPLRFSFSPVAALVFDGLGGRRWRF